MPGGRSDDEERRDQAGPREIKRSLTSKRSVDNFAENIKFHAPGIGLELKGRGAALARVREFVEQADVHYDVEEIVEHGAFSVVFARSTGTLDGQRMAWDLCQVLRYEEDKAAETWVLRGAAAQPARAG